MDSLAVADCSHSRYPSILQLCEMSKIKDSDGEDGSPCLAVQLTSPELFVTQLVRMLAGVEGTLKSDWVLRKDSRDHSGARIGRSMTNPFEIGNYSIHDAESRY